MQHHGGIINRPLFGFPAARRPFVEQAAMEFAVWSEPANATMARGAPAFPAPFTSLTSLTSASSPAHFIAALISQWCFTAALAHDGRQAY